MKRAPEAIVELRRGALVGQQETLDHAAYIVDNRSSFRE
jgi:hypothetical protein